VAARRTPERSRAGRKRVCKTAHLRGDECIAVARDLWFEELGFPIPSMPAKDPIRGANLIGSRRRQAVAVASVLAPNNGRHDNDQT
jgi:hypothetical protein